MKKLILALTLTLVGAQAHAARGIQEAKLNKFFFQVNSPLAQRDIQYGNVKIDRYKKEITLDLQPAFHCPNGAMCAMVMPAPVVITLPLKSITKGGCNETIYTAERNMMPVDGPALKLEVLDNTYNFCEMFPTPPPTVVNYTIETPRPYNKEIHVMYGETLEIE